MSIRWKTAIITLSCVAFFMSAGMVYAQNAQPAVKSVTLYVDRATGQVFMSAGANRAPVKLNAAVDTEAIEHQVEEQVELKTHDELEAAVAEGRVQQQQDTDALAKKVAAITPPVSSYLTNFQNKFRIGTLAFLDYGLYTHTGFGPQFS